MENQLLESIKAAVENCNSYDELTALTAQFMEAVHNRRQDESFRKLAIAAARTKKS